MQKTKFTKYIGVGEGKGSDEFFITKVDKFKPAINVINCYGEQRKTKVEEVEAKWENTMIWKL